LHALLFKDFAGVHKPCHAAWLDYSWGFRGPASSCPEEEIRLLWEHAMAKTGESVILGLTFLIRGGDVARHDTPLILKHTVSVAAIEGYVLIEKPEGRRFGDGHFFLLATFEYRGGGSDLPGEQERPDVEEAELLFPLISEEVEYHDLDSPPNRGWRRERGESWDLFSTQQGGGAGASPPG